jgi:hypothetical protein
VSRAVPALLGIAVWTALLVATATPASARSGGQPHAIIVTVDDAALDDLLADPWIRSLAAAGGAGLLSTEESRTAVHDLRSAYLGFEGALPFEVHPAGSVEPPGGALDRAAGIVTTLLSASDASDVLVLVASNRAPAPDVVGGLTAVVMASGDPGAMVASLGATAPPVGSVSTLTSDSTGRDGVVTSADLAETVSVFAADGAPRDTGGAVFRVVDGPPPLDLYERYLQQRRLYVPVGIAAGLYVTIAGLICLGLSAFRRRLPRWSSWLGAALAIAVVPLALSLLLVGHLDRLTYATVVPFVLGVTGVGAAGCTAAGVRRGPLIALAWAGAVTLAALAAEAALGWTAAITPLLGGSQLDGGRFFGMPNVQIGLVLGASVYVAQRLRSPRAGAAVVAVSGLVAGLPWTGSNLGAAVTLFASAGIWYGVRTGGGWARVLGWTIVASVAGGLLVAVVHRVLAPAETHISRFAEEAGGVSDLWERFVERLGVGARLIANNPFALVPVVGVIATLVVVLRPPARVRETFVAHPGWRDALVTILLGSAVAYVANDSGAAALGLGFGTALAGLMFVSLLTGREKMERT